MNGSPLGPIEKRLQSVQSKVALLIGRCEQLSAVVEEYEAKAKKEHSAAVAARVDSLFAESEAALKEAEAALMAHSDLLTLLLTARAKYDAVAAAKRRLVLGRK
jgi:hypothetical protein